MFEFLLTHNNTENPTALTILITVLCAFFLSSLVVLTYELTTKSIHRPVHFLQSMALISIVAATVMQAIGDSLARGLGMLGALAIIRFRTRLDDPRNITFMFAALATGIACGVFGFTTAFIGTIGFCVAAFILRFSPLATTNILVGSLQLVMSKDGNQEEALNKILKVYCIHFELQQLELLNLKKTNKIKNKKGKLVKEIPREHLKSLTYSIRVKSGKSVIELSKEIEELPDIRDLRISFEQQNFRL